MTFNSLTIFFAAILPLMMIILITKFLFKTKKKSAKNINKLIEDLEKKYIY